MNSSFRQDPSDRGGLLSGLQGGADQASLARIAERAGISKGVIGYQIAGKDDLIREVVVEVLARAREYMEPRIRAASSGPEMLRAYIESDLAFMGAYRNHVIAIAEIARNARRPDGESSVDPAALEGAVKSLVQLLATFQKKGEFRADFDPLVMATAIRAAIDAVPRRLASDPGLELEHFGRELADLFDLATRSSTTRGKTQRRRPSPS